MTLQQFELGDYLVDVIDCKIIRLKPTSSDKTKPVKSIPVEPKAMLLLHHLALNQGMIISQKELFKAVWPNGIFSQGSVQRCIAQLRKAFGDNATKQAVIVTHPKQGYSLKLTVIEVVKNKSEHVQENITATKKDSETKSVLNAAPDSSLVTSNENRQASVDEKTDNKQPVNSLAEESASGSNSYSARWYLVIGLVLIFCILSFLWLND